MKVQEKITQLVDTQTGELLNTTVSRTFYSTKKTDNFLYTYAEGLSMIYGVKRGSSIRVLFKLLELTRFNNPKISISAPLRKEIVNALEISDSAYNKAIEDLKIAGIIEGSRGYYQISPEVFWCGDSKIRESILSGRTKCAITFSAVEVEDFYEE